MEWKRVLVYGLGASLRAAMTLYGVWMDSHSRLRYTDIDYDVLTDAAVYAHAGASVYDRATYRYSPFVAWLLVPGVVLGVQNLFGKILWCMFDVVAAWLLEQCVLLSAGKSASARALVAAALWLLNPVSINVSTRGNYDALVCVLVAGLLCAVAARKVLAAAVCLGIAVHLRIYPLIYALPLLFQIPKWHKPQDGSNNKRFLFLCKDQWLFGITAVAVFFILGSLCFVVEGYPFLEHTYLYHLTRADHRHNLSPYWHTLLLNVANPNNTIASFIAKLATFVPQTASLAFLGYSFIVAPPKASFPDTAFGMWAMTLVFIAYNKVYTVQYFNWWLVLAPVADLSCKGLVSPFRLLRMALLWAASLALWMFVAYGYEFNGQNTFIQIWAAGLLLFAASVEPVIELTAVRLSKTKTLKDKSD